MGNGGCTSHRITRTWISHGILAWRILQPGGNTGRTKAELFQHDGEVCKAPAYEYMDDRCRKLFVRTTRPVQQGEEILIDYGYHPHRQTKWGFGPKAKKPAFKANYNLRAKGVKGKITETKKRLAHFFLTVLIRPLYIPQNFLSKNQA